MRKIYLILYICCATVFLLSAFLVYVCDRKMEDPSDRCSREIVLGMIRFKILTTSSVSYWNQESRFY